MREPSPEKQLPGARRRGNCRAGHPTMGQKGGRGGEAAVKARSISPDFPPNFSLLLLLTFSENSERDSSLKFF